MGQCGNGVVLLAEFGEQESPAGFEDPVHLGNCSLLIILSYVVQGEGHATASKLASATVAAVRKRPESVPAIHVGGLAPLPA